MTGRGWIIPPPKAPAKSREELERERIAKVGWLTGQGLLSSERIRQALLKVPREDFIPREYRDYAYLEVPLPLPGEQATISCPHSYPLFYEPLGLDRGHRFLEIGLGSGYGAAVAREVVGEEGLVVALEIDPLTFAFAKGNLEQAGYRDVVLVNADGGLGYPERQPYDRIAITAACPEVPPPLMEQLATGGRLIAPVIEDDAQMLVLLQKTAEGMRRRELCEVLYVALRGVYGAIEEGGKK
jgi:protein-L-isoaspartate(D-aspartate) O-methyltransferase